MRRPSFLLILPALLSVACSGAEPQFPDPRIEIVETRPLHINALYPSMTGPMDRVPVDFEKLDWVRALRTEVIDMSTGEPMGEEFFCHAQLQMPDMYRPMVTATGISEIRFPAGFALPLARQVQTYRLAQGTREQESAPLTFLGMVLNNHEPDIDRQTRVRATIEYWRNEDIDHAPPVKALYRATLPMTVADLDQYVPDGAHEDVTTHCQLVDDDTNHWLVPPGTQRTRKRYSGFLEQDTTVHYGVVHLHNYAVYMRLTDLNTNRVLWQTDVVYESDRAQIARIPVYSSGDGFELKADHEYEIEAFYDNPTDHDIDAMAMMSLYHHPGRPSDLSRPERP